MSAIGSEIRFLRTAEGVRVAYRVLGHGPAVVVPPWWFNHLDVLWESTSSRTFFETLAERCTVVLYDKPGSGLSDRNTPDLTTDDQARTLESLVDHLSLRRFSLFAHSAAGPPAVTYTARHPERVTCLTLFTTKAFTPPPADAERQAAVWEASKALMRADWGLGSSALVQSAVANRDPNFYAWLARYIRESVEPETAIAMMEHYRRTDVRERAAQVRTPTLVLHRRDDPALPFERGLELAACIPDARFVPLEGAWHALYEGDVQDVLDHTMGFLREATGRPQSNGAGPDVQGGSGAALSAREREVLALIAAGKTDAQIAEALTIAPTTASRHVHNILEKLGMSRRSEAAVWWASNGPGVVE